MLSFVFSFSLNYLDFLILTKLLNYFSKKDKCGIVTRIFILLIISIVISFINQQNNPNMNLIFTIVFILLYSYTFTLPYVYNVLLPILYIGVGIVVEPVGLIAIRCMEMLVPERWAYAISVILCEIIRLLFVVLIPKVYIQLHTIPLYIHIMLCCISGLNVIICCVSIQVALNNKGNLGNVLCFVIVVTAITNNFLVLGIVYKLSILMTENTKKESLLQEARAKEEYYQEIEQSNKIIRELKHNMKNRLLAISTLSHQRRRFVEEIEKILVEIDESTPQIYSGNHVLNTILSCKLQNAKDNGIKVDVDVIVPFNLKFDYSDIGILIGNLLDNAIEACNRKINNKEKWIKIIIKYYHHTLLVEISNSKNEEKVILSKSSKKDFDNHGFGIRSIKSIVQKYEGTIEFMDQGHYFEVAAILYGVQKK